MIQEIKSYALVALVFAIVIGLFTLTFHLEGNITGFAVFNTSNQTEFEQGVFNRTFFNTTGNGFVMLNLTEGFTSGNYTSKVFDAGGLTNWTNISWVSNAIGELPSNRRNEITSKDWGDNGINMSGNVLLYHFNNASFLGEDNVRANDSSGQGNNGTVNGSARPNSTDYKLGTGSFTFTGAGDEFIHLGTIDLPGGIDGDSSFMRGYSAGTLSAWVNNVVNDGTWDMYITKPNQIEFGRSNSNQFFLALNDNFFYTGKTAPLGWHHVVGTFNGSNRTIYVDGVAENTSNWTVSLDVGFSLIGLGGRGGAHATTGNLDEVAIWNRSLSAAEIQNLYLRGATKLNISVRSCDDAVCSGESFTAVNSTSPQNISVSTNRYFQYMFNFTTENVNYTPELYNVTMETTDSFAPLISNENITDNNLTSGETGLINATVTDAEVDTVLVTINNTDGTLTNTTLSNIAGTNFYNDSVEVGKAGTWYLKVFANDTEGNLNNSRNFLSFTVSKPAATPQNEVFPDQSLSLDLVSVVAELNATDVLRGVNTTLNVENNFSFFEHTNQTQEMNNFTAGQVKNVTWFVSVPKLSGNYTFNISYYDMYGNNWNSSNFNITVNESDASTTTATFIDLINYVEVEGGDNYLAELTVLNEEGNAVPSDGTPVITLIDPLGDVNFGPSTSGVSNISIGRYNFTRAFASSSTGGQWIIVSNITRGGTTFIEREYFKVTSGPFDVRDINVLDNTVNDLAISVILENQGGATKDIYVEWNLTRVDNGELLDSGADTVAVDGSSTKTHSVNPTTSFVGQVKITFLGHFGTDFTEKAGANKLFVTEAPSGKKGIEGDDGGAGEVPRTLIPKEIPLPKIPIPESLGELSALIEEIRARIVVIKEHLAQSPLDMSEEMRRVSVIEVQLNEIEVLAIEKQFDPALRKLSVLTTALSLLEADLALKGLSLPAPPWAEKPAKAWVIPDIKGLLPPIWLVNIGLVIVIALGLLFWRTQELRAQLNTTKRELRRKGDAAYSIRELKRKAKSLDANKKKVNAELKRLQKILKK
jgi:hypothetical protein